MEKMEDKTLILMPLGEKEDYDLANSYVLYTSPAGIEIGSLDPELVYKDPAKANLAGIGDTKQFVVFVPAVGKVYDRPVYRIFPSAKGTVDMFEVINDVYVPLQDVIAGVYEVKSVPSVIEVDYKDLESSSIKK